MDDSSSPVETAPRHYSAADAIAPMRRIEGMWQHIQPIIRYVRAMAVVLVLWQLASLRIDNVVLLPSPIDVGKSLAGPFV